MSSETRTAVLAGVVTAVVCVALLVVWFHWPEIVDLTRSDDELACRRMADEIVAKLRMEIPNDVQIVNPGYVVRVEACGISLRIKER